MKTLGKVVQIDEAKIWDHLGELVRRTVEERTDGLIKSKEIILSNYEIS